MTEKFREVSSSYVAIQMGPHVGVEFHDIDLTPQVRTFEAGIDDISSCPILDNRWILPEITTEQGRDAAHRNLENGDVL